MHRIKDTMSIQGTKLIGYWSDKKVPVYDVTTIGGFNQIVGHVKHDNSNCGTVLYRGQAELYDSLTPSILHGDVTDAEIEKRNDDLKKHISDVITDGKLSTELNFGKDAKNRPLYMRYVIESLFQHYGIRTHFQDFVDNHWTALWFGLYKQCQKVMPGSIETDGYRNFYYRKREHTLPKSVQKPDCLELKREVIEIPEKPPLINTNDDEYTYEKLWEKSKQTLTDIFGIADVKKREAALGRYVKRIKEQDEAKNHKITEQWEANCRRSKERQAKIDEAYRLNQNSDIAYVYILMYVADTNGGNYNGVFTGTETVTIDLRKALPSTFLRPCAQHGWTVCKLDGNYDLTEGVVCVLRLTVKLVDQMLGNGLLVSQENFFPAENIDHGYQVLLSREEPAKFGKIILKVKGDLPSLFPFASFQHFINEKT